MGAACLHPAIQPPDGVATRRDEETGEDSMYQASEPCPDQRKPKSPRYDAVLAITLADRSGMFE